jgi:PAS domain S-box-containing protein
VPVRFSWLAPPLLGPAAGYLLSLAVVTAAIGLRGLLDPLLGDALPFVTLFGAVAAATWLSGLGAAIAVTVTGYLAVGFFFIPPRGELTISDAADVAGLLAYLFTCALIIVIGESMRWARAREVVSRDVLSVTLRSIGDAVITTDIGGKVSYLNTVAETVSGWSQQDAAGKPLETVFRVVNETTRQPVENPALRALREGVVVGLANHTVLIRRDGTECPIDDSAAPIRDERGGVSGCVLIFRDVTAQRQLAREKQQQLFTARRLASIVESSEVAIIGKGLDGIIQSWNAAAERLFGYTAEQATGRHISLVIPPERLAEENEIIATLKAGRRIEHFETLRVRADGERVFVSLTVSPIKDDDGNVVGASKMVRDITRERQAEDDLRKLAAELAESDRRKNEFLATLAHELRGPLAPIANALEIWKRSTSQEQLRQARETMERQLGQTVRLVDDLLDLNRITHNRLELRKARVELATVVEHALETCRPIADSRGHELTITLPTEPSYLRADAARLAQVFSNLLGNSCKYTDVGGKISLTARHQDDEVIVSVKDNGVGIPPDRISGVFDMFAQVGTSLEHAQGGLGIGLTLVKQLVTMHGGTVEAHSGGLGEGSEFVVRLPLERGVTHTAAATSRAETGSVQRRRVLVVDDNADAAISLSTLLELEGHHAITVHDGFAAIDAAEKHRPDVVLLDIGLPRLSGHEVCRRLRNRPWGKELVVIALTGWGQTEDRRKSQEAGFDGHLVKPVRYETLAELLGSLPPAEHDPASKSPP